MPYYVYILQSLKDNKYYIGSTSDAPARLHYHNAGLQRSTRHRIPFTLILFEEYPSKEEALKREKQIKSWKVGDVFKKLINGK
jgi:putative endonuclease